MGKVKSNLFLILLFFVFSCKKNESQINKNQVLINKTISEDEKVNILIQKVIQKGDFNSYSKLYVYYTDKPNDTTFISLSRIMVRKYGYQELNFNIFEFETRYLSKSKFLELNNFEKLNKIQKQKVIKPLEEGTRNNDMTSITTLIKIYKNGVEYKKNQKKVDSLLNIAKSIDPSFRIIE